MERIQQLVPEWQTNLLPEIQSQVRASGRKVVVLDDDPTGTQTVHNIPVLTEWSVASLRAELANDLPCFYILTNSRSLPLPGAQAMNVEIARNLREASHQAQRDFVIVSRSDSTLRGHFPGEVDALANALEQNFDGWLIIPFFLEGGRYTIGNVHYVAEGDKLVPAGETPFARDSAFGYRASNLREWVEEKTGGRVRADQVAAISIDDLRIGGPNRVAEKLMAISRGQMCAVNAASYRDVEVFVAGLLDAEAKGKRFLYRTAASFVRVRAGIEPRALLTQADLQLPQSGGGLVVVGSYVPKTTAQVEALLAQTKITGVEISVDALLDARRENEIARVALSAENAMKQNQDVVIYTSRQLVTVNDAEASLSIGQRVSDGLIEILHRINTMPRYLIAKGGITSSDVATKGLNVKRAMIRGQILPGVPVWRLGDESRYPGLDYIVFPGNVGTPNSLAEIIQRMKDERFA
jgi:uncharacterized protein YgbK (DUF1537 family)